MKASRQLITVSALFLAGGFAADGALAQVGSLLDGEYGHLNTSADARVAIGQWPNQQSVANYDQDFDQSPADWFVQSTASASGWDMAADAASWASWGVLKAEAITTNPDPGHTRTDSPEDMAYARAWFTDRLLVSGGTGTGLATLTAHVTGDFTGSASMGYAGASMQVSVDDGSNPTQWVIDFSRNAWGVVSFDETPSGSFQFTYGTPFSLSGELMTTAQSGGQSDAYGTASFVSIVIQDNPNAIWEIGTVVNGQLPADPYNVSAVPEAEVWGMLLAGLGLIGFRLRHRSRPKVGPT